MKLNLDLAFVGEGHPQEALPQIAEAIRLRPEYAEAHAYYGAALSESGRLTEAVEEYRASLKINPRNADVHYQLGTTLRKLGRFDEAQAEFAAAGSGN
jgi:Tfp pilus assembly protein PilF